MTDRTICGIYYNELLWDSDTDPAVPDYMWRTFRAWTRDFDSPDGSDAGLRVTG